MSWLMDVLKSRLDALLGTKVLGTIFASLVALLAPGLDPEVRAAIVGILWSIYTAFRAYQNSQITKAQIAADAAVEAARIAGGGAVVPVKESLEQFITRLTAEGKSPSEIAKAIEAR